MPKREWKEANPDRTKEIQNEYARRRRKRIRDFIDAQKEGKPCVDCGQFLPIECLDFDHVRGEKRQRLSQWHRFKAEPGKTIEELILDEISKCELRCANCHRIVTKQRQEQ